MSIYREEDEMGESASGPQASFVGAVNALQRLRGGVRHMSHKPTLSTQIGISQSATLTAANFSSGAPLPQISGLTRVYKSFQPEKAILTEIIIGVWTNDSGVTATAVTNVTDSADLVLVSAFSGADNCFPNAPSEANGISGPAFAPNSLGNGISWPIIRGGIDMSVAFAVEESAIYQLAVPAGYTLAEGVFTVKFRFNLMGPSLR